MPTRKTTDGPAGDGSLPQELVPVEPGDERLGLTDLLRACLERPAGPGAAASWKHRLIAGLIRRADDGDLKAIQEIWTRLEGRPGASRDAPPELPHLTDDVVLRILRAADDGDETGDGDDARDDDDEPERDDGG